MCFLFVVVVNTNVIKVSCKGPYLIGNNYSHHVWWKPIKNFSTVVPCHAGLFKHFHMKVFTILKFEIGQSTPFTFFLMHCCNSISFTKWFEWNSKKDLDTADEYLHKRGRGERIFFNNNSRFGWSIILKHYTFEKRIIISKFFL